MARARLIVEITPLSSVGHVTPVNQVELAADWEASWDGDIEGGTIRPELQIDDATRRYLVGTVDSVGNMTVTTKRQDPLATTYPSAVAGDGWVWVAGELEAGVGKWLGRGE